MRALVAGYAGVPNGVDGRGEIERNGPAADVLRPIVVNRDLALEAGPPIAGCLVCGASLSREQPRARSYGY